MDDGIFTIRARRCLRCGRLLTSEAAVKSGYGCACAEKARKEKAAAEPIPGQMSIEDWMKAFEEDEEDADIEH